MNDLVKALIEGIIGEDELSDKKIIGMFGGGFKPPTLGHLEVVKRALQENPEMDALVILVGSGTRNSISQKESLAIWNIYKKSLPSKVKVMATPIISLLLEPYTLMLKKIPIKKFIGLLVLEKEMKKISKI